MYLFTYFLIFIFTRPILFSFAISAGLLLSLLCVLCSAGPAGVRGVPIHLSTDVCQGLGRALLQEATDVLEMVCT